MYDLLIKNASTRGDPAVRVDIAVEAGQIAAVEARIEDEAVEVVDAGGNLVTPAFANPHLHLDKVYTLLEIDELAMQAYHGEGMGKAMNAIELASRVKESYDKGRILQNVRRALNLAVKHGNLYVRGFADIDNKAGLIGVEALLEARQEFQGVVDLQVVAFPQDGIVREPGAAELVREAMRMGADLVGGIPWIEYTDEDAAAHIDLMLDIAVEFDAGLSMLVDDAGDSGLRTLELLARKTTERGWTGRALAHHARAMALYPKPYLQKLIALLKRAEIGVVTDPHTGPLHARVRELREEGVLVCLGQDDISDAYYPFGQNNMLEVAFLASHLLWMTTEAEMGTLFDMITGEAARAMEVQDYGLTVGCRANLAVLQDPTVLEALRYHRAPAAVISYGKLIG